jgi:hypothetical protein
MERRQVGVRGAAAGPDGAQCDRPETGVVRELHLRLRVGRPLRGVLDGADEQLRLRGLRLAARVVRTAAGG